MSGYTTGDSTERGRFLSEDHPDTHEPHPEKTARQVQVTKQVPAFIREIASIRQLLPTGKRMAKHAARPKGKGTAGQQKRIPLPPELSGRRGERTAATYSPACAVPSARRSLTALFGMGRGGTSAQKPPQWDAENEHEARRRKRNALEWRQKKHAGN